MQPIWIKAIDSTKSIILYLPWIKITQSLSCNYGSLNIDANISKKKSKLNQSTYKNNFSA